MFFQTRRVINTASRRNHTLAKRLKKHAYTHNEWHRMTRMTGPDCAVMCNLINTHTHTHTFFSSIWRHSPLPFRLHVHVPEPQSPGRDARSSLPTLPRPSGHRSAPLSSSLLLELVLLLIPLRFPTSPTGRRPIAAEQSFPFPYTVSTGAWMHR